MTCPYSEVHFGAIRIDATSGVWTRSVPAITIGKLEYQLDMFGAGLRHGEILIAEPLVRGIPITVHVRSTLTGSPTDRAGANKDEVAALRRLFSSAGASMVALKTVRQDEDGNDVEREILTRVVGDPAWKITTPGETGSLVQLDSTMIDFYAELYAPFPFWRDTTEYTDTTTAENAAGGLTIVSGDISGSAAPGAKFSLSGGVNLPTVLTIENVTTGTEFQVNVGATVSDGSDYMDWCHDSPNEPAQAWSHADTYLVGGSSFAVAAGSNTITCRTSVAGDEVDVAVFWYKYYREP